VWSFELIWSNPLVVTDPRGRYVEHHTTPPDVQLSLAEYMVVGDGVDQDQNNEVCFIVAVRGDESAAGDIGVECGLKLAPGEVTHAGLLEKSNAAGINHMRRLFMLTDTRLLYVENKKSHRPKRELQLADIASVQKGDEFQPQEFTVTMRMAPSTSGQAIADAGRIFQLRAATEEEAEEWMSKITRAMQRVHSAIHVHVSNALGKSKTFTCQPTDRVVDLKLKIATQFGVDCEMQVTRPASLPLLSLLPLWPIFMKRGSRCPHLFARSLPAAGTALRRGRR
jgi:hypothetical protein